MNKKQITEPKRLLRESVNYNEQNKTYFCDASPAKPGSKTGSVKSNNFDRMSKV